MKVLIFLMLIGFIKAEIKGCTYKGRYVAASHIIVTDDCKESCICPLYSEKGKTNNLECHQNCQSNHVTCSKNEKKIFSRKQALNAWGHKTGCTCPVEKCVRRLHFVFTCEEKCPVFRIQCGQLEKKVEGQTPHLGCLCSTATCVGNPPTTRPPTTPTPTVTPTPTPKAEKKKDDGGGVSCFSETSFVRNEFGIKVSMKSVQVGDKVLAVDSAGHPVYSEVIMMLHRNPNAIADNFVKINTANNKSITLTKYHLIPTLMFVYSKDVKVNQSLKVFDESTKTFESVKVTSVEQVRGKGYYAPLTNHGTIVVDDVYASCYASVPFHHLAHWAFSFYRIMYPYLGVSSKQINAVNELHWYPNMLRSSANAVNILQRSL